MEAKKRERWREEKFRRGANGEPVPSALPELCQPLVPWWSESIHYAVAVGNRQESEAIWIWGWGGVNGGVEGLSGLKH